MELETVESGPLDPRGRRYTDADRDLAYQLWAYRYGQSTIRVSRALATIDPPVTVTDRTIRSWVTQDRWHDRLTQDITTIAPAIHRSNVVSIIQGSAEAIDFLRSQTLGEVEPSGPRTQGAGLLLQAAGYGGKGERMLIQTLTDTQPLALPLPLATRPDQAPPSIEEAPPPYPAVPPWVRG